MMPRRVIRLSGHTLRFYPKDGWDEDALRSALGAGDISYQSNAFGIGGYWMLRPSPEPSYFDPDRLGDLTAAVIGEREFTGDDAHRMLSIYGTDRVYAFGDDRAWWQRRNKL